MNKYELSEAYIGGPTGEINVTGNVRLGKGGGGGTSKTVSEIPKELKPLAEKYSSAGIKAFDTPFKYYKVEDRYAGLTDPQLQGIDMVQNRALQGSATVGNAENQLNSMISGGNTNPFLDQMFQAGADKVKANVNGNFAAAGRYGSGAHTGTLADSLGNMAAQMYGGAYENDRARQMQAIGMAPQFGNLAYQDASQLMNAGQILQDEAQNPLDFQYQQFTEDQNKLYKDMGAAAGIFQSQPYGSSSSTKQSGGGK